VSDGGRRVTVTGTGRATAAPDQAVVQVRADVLRPSAGEAVAAAQDCVDRVRAAARGVDPALAVESTSLTLHVDETWSSDPTTGRNSRQRNGFRAGHGLTVRVGDVGALGAVLTAVLAAAGDDLALDSVEHSVADPTTLRGTARARAWDDARARAAQHAAAAGASLGEVLEVVEDGAVGVPRPMAARMAVASAEVAVEPGAAEVQVQVQVTWGLA
jgi:uncharacterized protein YggE